MEKKLESRKCYLNKESFKKDLQLIFDNAKSYNKPSTIYYSYAVNLEEYIKPHLDHMTDPTDVELQEYAKIVQIKDEQLAVVEAKRAGELDDSKRMALK